MPRFFFHVRDDGRLFEDPDGGELPDLDAARAEAVAAAREVFTEQVRAGRPPSITQVEIRDGEGRLLDTVLIRDALGLRLN